MRSGGDGDGGGCEGGGGDGEVWRDVEYVTPMEGRVVVVVVGRRERRR